ncbi:MAG: HAD family hydrolase [Alphaproteobacteria bacterium]|jgi:phosphoglycolate phosphatase|nr:HAD family hydrolase [Alphaproteobacteria bacterium]
MFTTTPKAILFDWDNTLVDTWPLIHGGMQFVFENRGLTPWTLQQTKDRCHESARDAFPKLFPDDWQSAMDDFYKYVRAQHGSETVLLPFARDLIESLSSLNILLGVVSNKTRDILVEEIEHLGFSEHFGVIVGSGDAIRDKPDAAPLLLALDKLNVLPSADVWMIGDTPADWTAAKAAGVRAIGVGAPNMPAVDNVPDAMFLDLKPICAGLNIFSPSVLTARNS